MKKKFIIPAVIVIILAIIVGIVFISTDRKNKIAILMYHNLCLNDAGVNSETITVGKFEEDLRWLSDNGYRTVLPRDLKEFVREHDGEDLSKVVIITFDDGYRSNYELAYPLLQKYGMCAEVSVITSMTDDAENFFVNYCTWDMLREMSESGVIEVGSHTDNMHNPNNHGMTYEKGEPNGIARYSAGEVTTDIELSIKKISDGVGKAPVTFAYPFGENDKALDKIINSHFEVSFSTNPKMAHILTNLERLGRYRINQNTNLSDVLK